MDDQIILSTHRVRKSGDYTQEIAYSYEKAAEKFKSNYEVHWKKVLREVRKTSPRAYDAIDIYLKKAQQPYFKPRRNSPLPALKQRVSNPTELPPISTSITHNKPLNTTLPYLDTPLTPRPHKDLPSTKRAKKHNFMHRDSSTVSNNNQSRRSSPKVSDIMHTLDEIKMMSMNMKQMIGNTTQKVAQISPSRLNKSVEFGSKAKFQKSRRNAQRNLNKSIDISSSKHAETSKPRGQTRACESSESRSYLKDKVDLNSIQKYFENFHKKSKILLEQLEKNVLGSNKL